MKKYIYIIIIAISFFACKKEVKKSGALLEINYSDQKCEDSIDFSYKFKCEPVILETDTMSLIGEIHSVIVKKDRIYVFDSDVAKKLFVFDRKGKYLFGISPYGRGVGICLYLVDFDIYKNNIVFLSSLDRKLLFYDLKGNYVKTIKMDEFSNQNLKVIDDNLFVTTECHSGTKVDFWNNKGKLIKKYRNRCLPPNCNYGVFKEKAELNDTSYFYIPFNDTIFIATKEKEFKPAFYYNFGKRRVPVKLAKNGKDLEDSFLGKEYTNITGFTVLNDYIFMEITNNAMGTVLIYDRRAKKCTEVKKIYINGFYLQNIIGDYPNGFVSYMDSYHLCEAVKENKSDSYKIFKDHKPEDNPVLFIMTEKKGNEKGN